MIRSFNLELKTKSAYELAERIAMTSGILRDLSEDKTPEGVSRTENIQELMNGIREFSETEAPDENGEAITRLRTLDEFTQDIALLTDADEKDKDNLDTVSLMTIHSAKGLEFPFVYVVGLEENLFPSQLSLNSRSDLEEERRLFYVAITRAEKKLTITHAATRFKYGNLEYCEPSRFLEELPQNLLTYVGYNSNKWDENQNKFDRKFEQNASVKIKLPSNTEQYIHQPSSDFAIAFPEELTEGMEVEHQKFGFGKIISLEGNNDAKMATINFDKAGQKKILLKFAKLSIVKNN